MHEQIPSSDNTINVQCATCSSPGIHYNGNSIPPISSIACFCQWPKQQQRFVPAREPPNEFITW